MPTVLLEEGKGRNPFKVLLSPPSVASLLCCIFSNYAWLGRAWQQRLASVSGFQLWGPCTGGINRICNCCAEDWKWLHSPWGSLFKPNIQERQTSEAQHGVRKAGEYKQSVFLTECKFHGNNTVPSRTQLLPFSGPEMVTVAHWYPRFWELGA